ncbi:cyclin-dependent kinase inhibitor 2c-related [Anaeramoeba flamelloides]|uniref:Cyclin-dependent kinase inhibitor 2c-related n=1 Tax=Anaeramoeba flamelloides TaxID=1746091 RepID=A0ABQ8X1E6_9EUKA|nr:cyclin-dependent kinase inhibitor 2c-related [Anaeramoeba flamelloides]
MTEKLTDKQFIELIKTSSLENIQEKITEDNVNRVIKEGKTTGNVKKITSPLILAILHRPKIVVNLIELGADIKFTTHIQPIHYACREGNYDITNRLILKGAVLDNNDDLTPLHYLCLKKFNKECFLLLLRKGLKIDECSKDTPLTFACKKNPSYPLIQFLLFKGANVNYRNAQGHSPLHILAQNKAVPFEALKLIDPKTNKEIQTKETPKDIAYKIRNTKFLTYYILPQKAERNIVLNKKIYENLESVEVIREGNVSYQEEMEKKKEEYQQLFSTNENLIQEIKNLEKDINPENFNDLSQKIEELKNENVKLKSTLKEKEEKKYTTNQINDKIYKKYKEKKEKYSSFLTKKKKLKKKIENYKKYRSKKRKKERKEIQKQKKKKNNH